jgi:predicted DNA-binding helix-hairpin-helix protein
MLDLNLDPKLAWALGQPHDFPVNINTAEREMLLRVPGLGTKTVKAFSRRGGSAVCGWRIWRGSASRSRKCSRSSSAEGWTPHRLIDRQDLRAHVRAEARAAVVAVMVTVPAGWPGGA